MPDYDGMKMMDSRDFENIFYDMVYRSLEKYGLVKIRTGVVTAYNSTTREATVRIVGDPAGTTSLYPNTTSFNLSPNDIVKLTLEDGSLTSAYISSKTNETAS